jgi:methylated-DNA-protein-cysteine methyltransferase-like protein
MAEKTATQQRHVRIWQTICDIPPGKVASYGQIAEIAGIPRGARQVGHALRQLPAGHEVPWFRVVASSGSIAFEKGSKPYREQRRRLMMDGISVTGGRVDMRRYRWQPDLDELLWKPSAAWDEC